MGNEKTVGCYGDGAFGHQHTRNVCAAILKFYAEAQDAPARVWQIAVALRDEMSDDAQEEYDACDWLNDHAAVEGAFWGWQDGDFGLWTEEVE